MRICLVFGNQVPTLGPSCSIRGDNEQDNIIHIQYVDTQLRTYRGSGRYKGYTQKSSYFIPIKTFSQLQCYVEHTQGYFLYAQLSHYSFIISIMLSYRTPPPPPPPPSALLTRPPKIHDKLKLTKLTWAVQYRSSRFIVLTMLGCHTCFLNRTPPPPFPLLTPGHPKSMTS